MTSTRTRAGLVWRNAGLVYVSYPTLPRAFDALCRLQDAGYLAEFDGMSRGRLWIRFHAEPIARWTAPPLPARALPRLHAAVARLRGDMDNQLAGSE